MPSFYQINKDCEIQIGDRLVIKALIPCKRTNSIKKFKLLGKVLRYNLYYFLTIDIFRFLNRFNILI